MSDLQHLENNEAILLMYLADELSPEDRAEVEQMLASDAAMRRELEILRQTQQLAYDALQTLDGSTRTVRPRFVALGQVSKLIHEWVQRRREPAPVATLRPPLPWWRISLSTAAALLIGYYVWAVYHPPVYRNPTAASEQNSSDLQADVSPIPPARELTPQEKVALLSSSLEDSASDEASNLDVAEVAAAAPSDGSDQNATGEP
jgi:hypothetical protein